MSMSERRRWCWRVEITHVATRQSMNRVGSQHHVPPESRHFAYCAHAAHRPTAQRVYRRQYTPLYPPNAESGWRCANIGRQYVVVMHAPTVCHSMENVVGTERAMNVQRMLGFEGGGGRAWRVRSRCWECQGKRTGDEAWCPVVGQCVVWYARKIWVEARSRAVLLLPPPPVQNVMSVMPTSSQHSASCFGQGPKVAQEVAGSGLECSRPSGEGREGRWCHV